jgi:molybdate/tungstate transport system substrate-binding protein
LKKSFTLVVVLVLAALGLASYLYSSSESQPVGRLVVFHAGSLSVPFAAMEKEFESRYPKVDVLREAGGSTKLARLISKVGKCADIMASADLAVIDKTLIPDHASFNIRFASNQLVLCYTDKSRFAEEINPGNWHEILQRQGVVWGHSDPDLYSAGYRSLMVLQLAEKFYQQPGLYEKLLGNRPPANVRPKAAELISLLQGGEMDYAWEYLSVAVQHGLRFVSLNDHINLGNYQMDGFYQQAGVKVTGAEPGMFITRKGQSITYGLTMLDAAPNKPAAEAFLAYLLDADGGLKILQEMGQPPFIPARVSGEGMKQKLPASLQTLVEVKE